MRTLIRILTTYGGIQLKNTRLKKPEGRNMPDWATKIHIALYPCYYHNYLLGELLHPSYIHMLQRILLKISRLSEKKQSVIISGKRYLCREQDITGMI